MIVLKSNASALNEEQIAEFLKEAVNAVKTEEDPDILNAYRKVFKKYVPFTLRSYIAAYLIKEFEASSFSRRPYGRRSNPRYQDRPRNFFSERPAPAERPVLDPAESVSIFISVGRSRRVFPRDIITLLIQNADVSRERIGDIRILENYSFVQVMSEDADNIIQKLHDFSYRGRTLSVSYSRKPENDEEMCDCPEETAAACADDR